MPDPTGWLAQAESQALLETPDRPLGWINAADPGAAGPSVGEANARRVDAYRQEYATQGEGPGVYAFRRAGPVGALADTVLQYELGSFRRKQEAGEELTPEEARRLAYAERILERIPAERSTAETVGSIAASAPGFVAETLLGTKLATAAVPRLAGAGLAAAAGRGAAATPAITSSYLPEAARQAGEEGRSILNPRVLTPALAIGSIQNAVVGHLSGAPGFLGRVPTRAGRAAVGGVLGTAEQGAADYGLSKFDELVQERTGHTLGLSTKYGTLGQLARRYQGEQNNAVGELFGQLVTFGVFAGLSSRRPGQLENFPTAAADPAAAAAKAIDDLGKQGLGMGAIAERLTGVGNDFQKALVDDSVDAWAGYWRDTKKAKDSPLKQYALSLAEIARTKKDRDALAARFAEWSAAQAGPEPEAPPPQPQPRLPDGPAPTPRVAVPAAAPPKPGDSVTGKFGTFEVLAVNPDGSLDLKLRRGGTMTVPADAVAFVNGVDYTPPTPRVAAPAEIGTRPSLELPPEPEAIRGPEGDAAAGIPPGRTGEAGGLAGGDLPPPADAGPLPPGRPEPVAPGGVEASLPGTEAAAVRAVVAPRPLPGRSFEDFLSGQFRESIRPTADPEVVRLGVRPPRETPILRTSAPGVRAAYRWDTGKAVPRTIKEPGRFSHPVVESRFYDRTDNLDRYREQLAAARKALTRVRNDQMKRKAKAADVKRAAQDVQNAEKLIAETEAYAKRDLAVDSLVAEMAARYQAGDPLPPKELAKALEKLAYPKLKQLQPAALKAFLVDGKTFEEFSAARGVTKQAGEGVELGLLPKLGLPEGVGLKVLRDLTARVDRQVAKDAMLERGEAATVIGKDSDGDVRAEGGRLPDVTERIDEVLQDEFAQASSLSADPKWADALNSLAREAAAAGDSVPKLKAIHAKLRKLEKSVRSGKFRGGEDAGGGPPDAAARPGQDRPPEGQVEAGLTAPFADGARVKFLKSGAVDHGTVIGHRYDKEVGHVQKVAWDDGGISETAVGRGNFTNLEPSDKAAPSAEEYRAALASKLAAAERQLAAYRKDVAGDRPKGVTREAKAAKSRYDESARQAAAWEAEVADLKSRLAQESRVTPEMLADASPKPAATLDAGPPQKTAAQLYQEYKEWSASAFGALKSRMADPDAKPVEKRAAAEALSVLESNPAREVTAEEFLARYSRDELYEKAVGMLGPDTVSRKATKEELAAMLARESSNDALRVENEAALKAQAGERRDLLDSLQPWRVEVRRLMNKHSSDQLMEMATAARGGKKPDLASTKEKLARIIVDAGKKFHEGVKQAGNPETLGMNLGQVFDLMAKAVSKAVGWSAKKAREWLDRVRSEWAVRTGPRETKAQADARLAAAYEAMAADPARQSSPATSATLADRRAAAAREGKIAIPQWVKDAADWIAKRDTSRTAGRPAGVNTAEVLHTPLPPKEFEAMVMSPEGLARVPVLARLAGDVRGVDRHPATAALVSAGVMRDVVGPNEAARWVAKHGAELRRLFTAEESDGKVPMANGQRRFMEDSWRREMKKPGSQPFTPEQRAFFDAVMRPEQAAMKAIFGTERVVVRQGKGKGKPLKRVETFFSRPVLHKIVNGRKLLPDEDNTGYAAFKGRSHRTEAAGYKAGYRYDLDPASRMSKQIEGIYSSVAERRMELSPALAAAPASMDTFLKKTAKGVTHPVFGTRELENEVADRVAKYLGERGAAVKKLADVSDMAKAVKETVDDAVGLTQGLLLLARSPKAWYEASKVKYRTLYDPKFMEEYLARPRVQDAIRWFSANGVRVTNSQDSQVQARPGTPLVRALKRLDVKGYGPGALVERFGRSQPAFLTAAKLELASALYPLYPPAAWPSLAQQIEAIALQGRGRESGVGVARDSLMRLGLNAPGYKRAVFTALAMAAERKAPANVVRTAVLRLMGGTVTLSAGLMAAAGMSEDEILERLNPDDSRFLMANLSKWGVPVEYGLGGPFRSLARLAGKLYSAGKDGDPDAVARTVLDWIKQQGGPLARTGLELATGRDALDRPVTPAQSLVNAATPIAFSGLTGEGTATQKAFAAPAGFFGFNVFPESKGAPAQRQLDDIARRMFGQPYARLKPQQMAAVERRADREGRHAKEPLPPEAKAYATRKGAERAARLQSQLSDVSQERLALAERGLAAPPRDLDYNGRKVRLSPELGERHEELLAEEYDRELKRLPAAAFRGKSDRARKAVDAGLERARTRARRRLWQEARSGRVRRRGLAGLFA